MSPSARLRRVAALCAAALLLATACAGPAAEERPAPGPSPSSVTATPTDGSTSGSPGAAPSPTPSPLPPAEGIIRVGLPLDRPGLSEGDPDAAVTGLDADVARAVADYLGFDARQISWVDLTSLSAAEELAAGRVDVAVGGIPADAHGIVVAGPYLAVHHDLLTRGDARITGPGALGGRTVCVVEGSAAESALTPLLPKRARVLAQHGLGECAEALASGRVDAVAGDEPALGALIRADPARSGWGLVGAPFGSTAYGVGLPPGSSLCETLTTALQARAADGSAQTAEDALAEASGIGTDPTLSAAGAPSPAGCG